jgi:DNA-binding beta-propeller fold protein YncE
VLRQANDGLDFVSPMGIAIDTVHDEVVVANTGQHRVEFFDLTPYPTGSFLHQVPEARFGMQYGLPKHVAVDLAGNVLISDLLVPYVDVVDYRGRAVTRLRLPAPDDAIDKGQGAGALAVSPDGTVLVASRGKEGRVYRFSPEYQPAGSWGVPGKAEGQLAEITALAVTPRGQVVVACRSTEKAVQVFDSNGVFLRGFGVHDIGPGDFSFPSGVAVTADGRIWVCDELRQLVQVFDSEGSFLGSVGSSGDGPGQFNYPSGLASDGRGLLALAEQMGNRFQLMWVR